MNIFKLLLAFSLFSSLFVGQAFSGPANKSNNDKLVNSYLIVEKLSRDGNANAISNKKTMYSFLNQEQKNKVNKIITMKLDNKVNL
ncbi:hypothetical protein OAE09_01825 [Alphaproteobacteria bacterium]|jgi:hypothetical protein|nr:hypothetical protein [Alphaproteobacteria bacterium]MDB9971379.1 hypothetical protein [Alphaproteobacteria bacterium]|tara:strand:- start:139 stop:396 length:258 start_codon:yes stop_codon:yes gene_type:complete